MDGLGNALEARGGDGDDWLDWLTGDKYEGTEAAAAADRLAAQNDAEVIGGPDDAEVNGSPGYWVEVRTLHAVGDTIIPGTENDKAKAHATAVIEPRCDLPTGADADPSPDPLPDPDDGNGGGGTEDPEPRPEPQPVELICDGDPVEIDPGDFDPADLPDASLLFSVHLAD